MTEKPQPPSPWLTLLITLLETLIQLLKLASAFIPLLADPSMRAWLSKMAPYVLAAMAIGALIMMVAALVLVVLALA